MNEQEENKDELPEITISISSPGITIQINAMNTPNPIQPLED